MKFELLFKNDGTALLSVADAKIAGNFYLSERQLTAFKTVFELLTGDGYKAVPVLLEFRDSFGKINGRISPYCIEFPDITRNITRAFAYPVATDNDADGAEISLPDAALIAEELCTIFRHFMTK